METGCEDFIGMPIRPVPKVLPIAAIAYSDENAAERALLDFARRWGEVILRSSAYDFSRFTDYYEPEMGGGLRKFFAAFGRLVEPDAIVDMKQHAMAIEDAYRKAGNRTVNLDPGYLEYSKLVMASTKNFDHRVYLAKGIYADVQLRYRGGQFRFNDWTYPDYKSQLVLDFLNEARQHYIRLEKASRAVRTESLTTEE